MRGLVCGRRRNARGVTAVVVALLMVALLGLTAIAVDVGTLWADRRQLQNGADAAALAVAQDCAELNGCSAAPPNASVTAANYAGSNTRTPFASNATASIKTLTIGGGEVLVETQGVRPHWFAPVLGFSSSTVTARAKVKVGKFWTTAALPLAISACQFYWQTGINPATNPGGTPTNTDVQVLYMKTATAKDVDLTTQCYLGTGAHNEVAGGFGWLDLDGSKPCTAKVTSPNIVGSDPGLDSPACLVLHTGDIGATVNIPIFTKFSGTGGNATYQIAGFAGFKVTAYCFNHTQWTDFSIKGTACNSGMGDNGPRLEGFFTGYTALEGELSTDPSVVSYGSTVIRLVKDW